MTPLICIALTLQSLTPPPVSRVMEPSAAPVTSAVVVRREAWVMGTRMRLIADGPTAAGATAATELVLTEVERLEGVLSTWDPSTEMSRVNHAPLGAATPLSPELHLLLLEARDWSRETGGAFDPVVGALVDVWDLRGRGRAPGAGPLRQARAASGAGALEIDPNSATAVRRDRLAWIDTGGFGKGAALRSASDLLERPAAADVRVLADLGGQVWAAAPPERPWRVPVADPSDRNAPLAELLLHDVSAATSGASERWVEVEGAHYAHVVDPRTGRPVRPWGSVTVVHPDPLAADVLSTALFVMGPRDGMRWLEAHPDIAALFLDIRSGGVVTRWTPAMEPWLAEGIPDGGHVPAGP